MNNFLERIDPTLRIVFGKIDDYFCSGRDGARYLDIHFHFGDVWERVGRYVVFAGGDITERSCPPPMSCAAGSRQERLGKSSMRKAPTASAVI